MNDDALIDLGLRVLGFAMIGVFLVAAVAFYWWISKKHGIPFDQLLQGFLRAVATDNRGSHQVNQFVGALTEPSADAWPPFAQRRGLAWDGRVFQSTHGSLRVFVGNGTPGAATAQEAFAKPLFWHLRVEFPRPLGLGLDARKPDDPRLAALRADFEVARLEASLLSQEFKIVFDDRALSLFHYRPPVEGLDFAFEAALGLAARLEAITR